MNNIIKISKTWVAEKLPKRPLDANKGTFGKVLVIAGSEKYPGAAYLSCAAAYRVGAGLVTLATKREVKIIVSRKLPEITFLSFSESLKKLSRYDVILIGSGLGQTKETKELIKKFLNKKLPKLIIDGDGLNILSGIERWWDMMGNEVILTPHPGEMSRLSGLTTQDIQSNREDVAKKFATNWGQIVILKGANTVIAPPKGRVSISPFANPLLSTAGTGDILAGVIAGFIAQGLVPFDAACIGVYIHGLAGEVLRDKFGQSGLLASDLLPVLPKVIKQLS